MIYVGTCGYAYKDWVGPFYPATTRPGEMLGYYARRFPAVEIDASFYGVPAASTIAGLHARTPPAFRFSFKAPQSVTHATGPHDRVHDEARLLRERLEPLQSAGKLAAVLLQFPNGFRPDRSTERYLHGIAAALDGLPLVAEFRHRLWQNASTITLLSELRMGWCNVDMPAYDVLPAPSSEAVSHVGYVRFHGRNLSQWWTGDNVTRYRYEYDAQELEPWIGRIAEIEERTDTVFAFFNNHARGSAARNAELLEAMLEERYGPAAREKVARATGTAPLQDALPGLNES